MSCRLRKAYTTMHLMLLENLDRGLRHTRMMPMGAVDVMPRRCSGRDRLRLLGSISDVLGAATIAADML